MTKKVEKRIESLTPEEVLELHQWILNERGLAGESLRSRFLIESEAHDEETLEQIRGMVEISAERAADHKAREALGLTRSGQVPKSKEKKYKKLKKEHLEG